MNKEDVALLDEIPPEYNEFASHIIISYDLFNRRNRSTTKYFCNNYKLFFKLFHLSVLTPVISSYFIGNNSEFNMLILKNCRLLFLELDKIDVVKDKQLFLNHFYKVIKHWIKKYPLSVSNGLDFETIKLLLDNIYYPTVLDICSCMLIMRADNLKRFKCILKKSKFFIRLCCLCLRNRDDINMCDVLDNLPTQPNTNKLYDGELYEDSEEITDPEPDNRTEEIRAVKNEEIIEKIEVQQSNSQIYTELIEEENKFRNRVKNTVKLLLLFSTFSSHTFGFKYDEEEIIVDIMGECAPMVFEMLLNEKYYFYLKRLFTTVINIIKGSEDGTSKMSDKIYKKILDDSLYIYYSEDDERLSKETFDIYKNNIREEKAKDKKRREERMKVLKIEKEKEREEKKNRKIEEPVFRTLEEILEESTGPYVDYAGFYEEYFTPDDEIPSISLIELSTPKSKYILYIFVHSLTHNHKLLNLLFENNFHKFMVDMFFISTDNFVVQSAYIFIKHILSHHKDYMYIIKILEDTPFIVNLYNECKNIFSLQNNTTPIYRLNHSLIFKLYQKIVKERKTIKNTLKTRNEMKNYDYYISNRSRLLNILCFLDTEDWITLSNDFLIKELRKENLKYKEKEIINYLDDCYTETFIRYISKMTLKDIPYSDIFKKDQM